MNILADSFMFSRTDSDDFFVGIFKFEFSFHLENINNPQYIIKYTTRA